MCDRERGEKGEKVGFVLVVRVFDKVGFVVFVFGRPLYEFVFCFVFFVVIIILFVS